jgi:predicted RNase H-like HicB family nuclease
VATRRTRYRVVYERDEDGWWVARIPKVKGCHTQGRSIAQARSRIREALAACLDSDVTARKAEFAEEIRLPKAISSNVAKVAELTKVFKSLQRARTHAARRLSAEGISVRDAGEILRLSHQRVQQLVST